VNDIETIRTGTCPFTGNAYNCATCELNPPMPTGRVKWEICMSISGPFERNGNNIREWNNLAKAFKDEYGHPQTGAQVRDYFKFMQLLGADVMPMGERCDRFCYKHGCRGHKIEEENGGAK